MWTSSSMFLKCRQTSNPQYTNKSPCQCVSIRTFILACFFFCRYFRNRNSSGRIFLYPIYLFSTLLTIGFGWTIYLRVLQLCLVSIVLKITKNLFDMDYLWTGIPRYTSANEIPVGAFAYRHFLQGGKSGNRHHNRTPILQVNLKFTSFRERQPCNLRRHIPISFFFIHLFVFIYATLSIAQNFYDLGRCKNNASLNEIQVKEQLFYFPLLI